MQQAVTWHLTKAFVSKISRTTTALVFLYQNHHVLTYKSVSAV